MADLIPVEADVQHQAGATLLNGIAGAAITAGDPVYIDASDNNEVKVADANLSAAAAAGVGIAVNSAAEGQPVQYQTSGDLDLGVTLAIGTIYTVSPDGGIQPHGDLATGDFTCILGIGKTTALLNMNVFAGGVVIPA